MTSDPLHRVQTRRTTLYHATLDLEHAIGLPTGDLQNWRSQTLTAARQLADRITEHTRQAEAPGEFLDLVTTQAPHLVNAAKKLEAEHDKAESTGERTGPVTIRALRSQGQRLGRDPHARTEATRVPTSRSWMASC